KTGAAVGGGSCYSRYQLPTSFLVPHRRPGFLQPLPFAVENRLVAQVSAPRRTGKQPDDALFNLHFVPAPLFRITESAAKIASYLWLISIRVVLGQIAVNPEGFLIGGMGFLHPVSGIIRPKCNLI